MTVKLTRLFAVVLLSTLLSCGGNTQPEHTMDTTSPAGGPGLNVDPATLATQIDPICNMSMANAKIADTAHYNGGVYAFCSKGCKEEFKKDPAKYAVK